MIDFFAIVFLLWTHILSMIYWIVCMRQKIAIIGWWAAGMMAAATIIENWYTGEVHLFEKNKNLWAKVIISGWGRCNVTTSYYRWKDLGDKYIRWSEFVREAIGQFGPRKIFNRFENHGVPLKIEEDMRVFPKSDNGRDIVGVFEKLFSRHKSMRVHLTSGIDDIDYEKKKFILSTGGQKMNFDQIVIATGGNAYTATWSTGDAYNRAKKLWHTVTSLGPSLNSFLSEEKWMHELSGLSFEKAKFEITLSDGEKKNAIWPMLFTHFWISGPATFIVSAHSSFETINRSQALEVYFMPFVDRTREVWEEFFLQQAKEVPRKQITTILHTYLPQRIIDSLNTHIFAWALDGQIGVCSKALRIGLSEYLGWGWKISVVWRRAGDEFVTAWGVLLDEVNRQTMESKILPGLYFVGEILNVDGVTGWYNLTSSWATGRLAGKTISL